MAERSAGGPGRRNRHELAGCSAPDEPARTQRWQHSASARTAGCSPRQACGRGSGRRSQRCCRCGGCGLPGGVGFAAAVGQQGAVHPERSHTQAAPQAPPSSALSPASQGSFARQPCRTPGDAKVALDGLRVERECVDHQAAGACGVWVRRRGRVGRGGAARHGPPPCTCLARSCAVAGPCVGSGGAAGRMPQPCRAAIGSRRGSPGAKRSSSERRCRT